MRTCQGRFTAPAAEHVGAGSVSIGALEHAITIERPLADVFALLGDPANDPDWAAPVISVKRLTAGRIRVGTRYKQTSRTLGVRFALELQVVEFEPEVVIVLRSAPGRVYYRGERRFEPDGDGTRVTFVDRLRFPGPFRLMELVTTPVSGAQVGRDLEAVKRRLEAAAAVR